MRYVELYYFGHNLEKPNYLAYWHTRGGAHHYFIVDQNTADQLIKKDRYWRIEREIAAENFFKVFKRYTEFAVRKVDNTIYIAIPPSYRGWWIGKEGFRIKTIQHILNSKIILVNCIYVRKRRVIRNDIINVIWFIRLPPKYIQVELQDSFTFVKDFSDSNYTEGYVAPWDIKRILGLLEYIDDLEIRNIPNSTIEAIRIATRIFRGLPFIKIGNNGVVNIID